MDSFRAELYIVGVNYIRLLSSLCICALMFLTVAFGQSPTPKPPKVVVDSALEQSDHQTTSEELLKTTKAFECDMNAALAGGNASRRFNSPESVAESLGKRVDTIRVVGFAPKFSKYKFSELRETVLRVWDGRFQSSTCYMAWAEPTFWSVEAQLEFEDGKRGVLITDGSHVALKVQDGTSWFFRLLPAAQ